MEVTTTAKLLAWIVPAMLRWTQPVPQYEVHVERYADIARDFIAVAYDPEEVPLFAGLDGRARTLSTLVSIASYESNFDPLIDDGTTRGDGGKSVCFMQINLGVTRIVMKGQLYGFSRTEGWTGEDLIADRQKCIRAGLHMARESLSICKDLSLYTMGRCSKTEPKAKWYLGRGANLLRFNPAPAIEGETDT